MESAPRIDAKSTPFYTKKGRKIKSDLAKKKSAKPTTIKLQGILLPFQTITHKGSVVSYTILTEEREILLELSPTLETIANKLRWEKVRVVGYFDKFTKAFRVVRISIADTSNDEPTTYFDHATEDWFDWYQELSHIGNKPPFSMESA